MGVGTGTDTDTDQSTNPNPDSRIRLATPADAASIRSIYTPFVESTPITFEETPPTEAETAERIESTLETYPWLVCERDGEVVGYAKAGSLRSMPAYRWVVELSVYVADDARRSGVATGLYTSLLEILERQGYQGAYAASTVPNPESARFHERMGFERIGVFPDAGYMLEEWHDVQWWHRPIGDEEPASEPDPPTPLPDARGGTNWERALTAGEECLAFDLET
ncbi:GNAT family N-acetyltransferase [Halobacteria archaeon AArc-m2/3/4]|uniref:GNAT family N-acetyltransferase n=1 Tax=Natronoglomus mannanivorans TaxID=2979990 RepID=A0ABT2QDU9_9EURY|nr:GNAT family N-acetyltransferase [Halobacteria archaeon AArc-m2/3/4]